MTAYYNEIDPFAAEWLRALIAADQIAPGDVDTRSIVDVRPDDLRGYTQCHFFAGIGVWSYALRLAGWPDSRSVWTMSCPCQPFSAAGKGGGFDDERHLWPAAYHLIRECRPGRVLGEQVASKDGLAWLDLVQADMEGARYAFGAIDTCSAGSGAPHIRQRLRFAAHQLADTYGYEPRTGRDDRTEESERLRFEPGRRGAISYMEHAESNGRFEGRSQSGGWGATSGRGPGKLDIAASSGRERIGDAPEHGQFVPTNALSGGTGPTNGFWRDADWLFCRDGKWRPVEPGTFPLAHGAPARVGRLRGYGNAVDAEATRIFIEAYLETQAIDADRHLQVTDIFA